MKLSSKAKKIIIVVSLVLVVLIIFIIRKIEEPSTTVIEEVVTSIKTIELVTEDDYVSPLYTEPIIVIPNEKKYKISNRALWELGVIGEISIPGTLVDDLVAQGVDNTYYLDKDIYGNDCKSGYLFADYRNTKSEFDLNNIIYGHNMKDGTRFGTLTRMLNESYYKDNNPDKVIYYNTINYDNRFEIYSVYEIDLTTFNYIQTGFTSDTEFAEFVAMTKMLNQISCLSECQNEVSSQNKILTLSTCTQGGTHRLVVHAYLVDSKPAI